MLIWLPALPCHAAWDILLHELQRLWLVSFFHSSSPVWLLAPAQCGGMDQDQTFYDPKSELDIRWYPMFDCGANLSPNL